MTIEQQLSELSALSKNLEILTDVVKDTADIQAEIVPVAKQHDEALTRVVENLKHASQVLDLTAPIARANAEDIEALMRLTAANTENIAASYQKTIDIIGQQQKALDAQREAIVTLQGMMVDHIKNTDSSFQRVNSAIQSLATAVKDLVFANKK